MPHVSSSTTPTFLRTSSVHRSGTATPPRPPSGWGHCSPGQYRGRTRLHHLGQRARSAPSDCRRTGQASLRDILTSLRALAGGHYQAPRPTVPTAPNASAPTLLEKTKIRHLATGSRAGNVLGRLLPYHLRHPRPTGRTTGTGTPVDLDVAGAALNSETKGRMEPRGLPLGWARRKTRRTRKGGRP